MVDGRLINPDHKGKALRLVDFLLQVSRMRDKITRNVRDYNDLLWLNNIPRSKGCYTRAWGPNEEYDTDIWIEYQSYEEPVLPKIPESCKDWIEGIDLHSKLDMPMVPETIVRQVENPAWKEGSDEPQMVAITEHIDNFPLISKKWDEYVEKSWLPWVEMHDKWEPVQKVYTQIFSIYQELQRLGEDYELILGLGLLGWRDERDQIVQRHLLVADAKIEFDSKKGKFAIGPAIEGPKLRVELDMLEIDVQPKNAEEEAHRELLEFEGDPWEISSVQGVLRSLVHSLDSNGEYDESLVPHEHPPTKKPIVKFAPALILRKRSTRGLQEILRKIRERVDDTEIVTPQFYDLAEIDREADGQRIGDTSGDENGGAGYLGQGEVYFPKPFNEEQIRIVQNIDSSSGVIVQGPPGTGKSHTIANVICHLLATGHRILVTGKTPRALEVLEGLVPDELNALCINLLGKGVAEQNSLESSVNGILRKDENWNEEDGQNELRRSEAELEDLRKEKAAVERRLRGIREAEIHAQSVANGAYLGTAARIAECGFNF